MSARFVAVQERRRIRGLWTLPASLLLALAACNSSNNAAAPGTADEPVVGTADSLPGVEITISAVRGGSGSGGKARVGDKLAVDFTLQTTAGAPLELSTMARGAIMVSGPTSNYQRVIASQSDVLTTAVKTALGAYTYTFTVPIPSTYVAPLNDTTDLTDGEMTGEALIAGTYTVGLEIRKDYTVDGVTYRDPGNASADFLFGDASTLEPREVVTLANCNQCHNELHAHGDNRDKITNCLLCHTSGAEDGNVATSGGGTPGVAIDFKVLIHKIHAGGKLPSVLGVATNSNGSRNYSATPTPYIVQGFQASLHDYSEFAFPVWPSMLTPMPRDTGYSTLNSTQQGLENTMRSGAIDCDKCHGDPDGDGPLPAPAEGDLIYNQPSRQACGSCHDDWNPEYPYVANSQTMPAQRDNAACTECHRESGTALDVRDAHTHPLKKPDLAQGLHIDITNVTDVGNADGTFDAGENVQITMTIKDDAGADIAASALSTINAVINGPTTNPNLVHYVRIYAASMGSGPTYTFNLPQNVYYESVGTSTGSLETFTTARAPHVNVTGAATSLLLRTGTGASSTLAADASALQNFIDVATGTGSSFVKDNYIVIEDLVSGRREFLKIQRVEDDRLWFSSLYSPNYAPGLSIAHASGSTVDVVTTSAISTSNYSLDTVTGLITETGEFGSGEILCSYTTDFVVPSEFPGTFGDSPDLDQSWGDWIGLAIPAGTYNFGIWGARTFSVTVGSDTTSYTEGSMPEVTQLLFGDATEVETVTRIDSTDGCYRCHNDIQFHGGSRRGYETCTLCHTLAGAEDAATYVYPTGEASTGVTIDFRTMLHKIHHGKELSAGANYLVAGFGGTGHSYEAVGFPVLPGGTVQCTVCHGTDNTAWLEPAERTHASETLPVRSWRATCGACHDSNAAAAHIDVNTSPSGAESCAICHGQGRELDVRTVHRTR